MMVSAIPTTIPGAIYQTSNGAIGRMDSSSFFGLTPSLVLIDMRVWRDPLSSSQARSHLGLTFLNTSIPYLIHDTLYPLCPSDCGQ